MLPAILDVEPSSLNGAPLSAVRRWRGTWHPLYCSGTRKRKQGRITVPLPSDIDTTSPKYLRDKYATVGVGETAYTRGSGRTTQALATQAGRTALRHAG